MQSSISTILHNSNGRNSHSTTKGRNPALLMRIPYIAGRWVRGRDHYGRRRLINYLLSVDDPAIWLIGTRRMGKTSLLRQLELETNTEESELVPLFWDLQGCESFDDLSYELFLAVEDVAERFYALGVDVESLEKKDAVAILRRINRALAERSKRLFVLIDEAEVLINIARRESKWLARLRKSFQNGRQRTIITSTKLLAQLNDLTADWETSPFLFGFSLANLWSMDPQASVDVILQRQGTYQMDVPQPIMEDLLLHTHRHPYLIQHLCQKLFLPTGEKSGTLRPPSTFDLTADHLLAGFFQVDFQHLVTIERRILLAVSKLVVASDEDLIAELNDLPPDRIRMFMYGLDKLGYLRKPLGQWAVGNEFLRRWMQENYAQLSQKLDSTLNDENIEALLQVGRTNELTYLHGKIERLQKDLRDLQHQYESANRQIAVEIGHKIQSVQDELLNAQHELAQIPG